MSASHLVTNLASLERVLYRRRNTRVWIALPLLPKSESARYELQMTRLLAESGDGFAMVGLAAAIAGCLFFDTTYWTLFAGHRLATVSANLLVCGAAGVLCKCFGLLRARWRLASLIWSIAETLEQRQVQERQVRDRQVPAHRRTSSIQRRQYEESPR